MRLLLVGQGAQDSGYGRVLRSLAPLLATSFEVVYFHINTRSPMTLPGVRCVSPSLVSDPYGLAEFPEILHRLEPDIMLACHDAPVLSIYARLAQTHSRSTCTVLYVPLESASICDETAAGLSLADALVCYTQTARGWLETSLGPANQRRSVLPHGLDRQSFGPVGPDGGVARSPTSRRQAQLTSRRLLGLPEGCTLVLNANRDTPRKRLDVTVSAFAEAARDAPDARLILTHGGAYRSLLRELGLDRLVIVPEGAPADDDTLNLYYNSCDIGVNTCEAEGWGLVALEHSAAGAAQLMPDHPSLREIWGSCAAFTHVEKTDTPGYARTDPRDTAVVLRRLLTEPAYRQSLAGRSRSLAASPDLAWPAIAKQWTHVLQRTALDRR